MTEVLQDPQRALRVLQEQLFGVTVDRAHATRRGSVVIDMTFAPLPELAGARYDPERARISVQPNGHIYSFPLGSERAWHHRYPSPLGEKFGHLAGELCLWYPSDPRWLRWEWSDGLEQFVTRVYRHVFYEEYYRREGHWPVEDAPHNDPPDGAHPIRTAWMRQEERRWAS
jgi:hypothetical protein